MHAYKHPTLWQGCVGAWCPSQDRSRSTLLTDFSPYNNHGTLTNMDPGTDWVASSGKVALDFDGVNGHVPCGVMPVLNGLTQLTVSVWINARTSGGGGFGRVITRNDASSFSIQLAASGANTTGITINGTLFAPTTGSLLGSWRHLCLVYQSAARMELWVDGLGYFGSTVTGGLASTVSPVTLGNRSAGDRGLDGWLDDVRIYNRALTASEVATLALRRGIAYETRRRRSYAVAAPATNPFFFQRHVLSRRSA